MMEIVDRKPIPIYEVVCHECGSRIRYTAAEVAWCHITCPVCGVGVWADTICPVAMDEGDANDAPTVDAVKVVRCKDCVYWERDVIFPDGFCRPRLQGNPNWYCADGERREEDNNEE